MSIAMYVCSFHRIGYDTEIYRIIHCCRLSSKFNAISGLGIMQYPNGVIVWHDSL